VAEGTHVMLTARREDRLRTLCTQLANNTTTVEFVAGDITDPDLRHRLVEGTQARLGGLDLLINNAGVGAIGPFLEAKPSRLRRVMEVNFFAPVELIRECEPLLSKGQQPMIVNIVSVLGHRAVPTKVEYCASKFAMHGFSDALRAELAGTGIDVLIVSPSTTQSEFFDELDEDSQTTYRRRGMAPESVAAHCLRAIKQGRHEVILSAGGKLLVWLDRLCPPWVNRLVAKFG
jgi:short-subunit dehydrogenase